MSDAATEETAPFKTRVVSICWLLATVGLALFAVLCASEAGLAILNADFASVVKNILKAVLLGFGTIGAGFELFNRW